MINYYIAYCWDKAGDRNMTLHYLRKAANAKPDGCFPNRLEDIQILNFVIEINPSDARAAYYLGNLFYDKKQYEDAIELWLQCAALDRTFATVFRNLGIAFYNKRSDQSQALDYFQQAFDMDRSDSRVLMELDQLYKRLNHQPEKRLEFLGHNLTTAQFRDDVYLEIISLHNFLGNYQKAFDLLIKRKFHPWEGGEGKVAAQYTYALIEMAKTDLQKGDFENAINKLEAAFTYPENLGEGKLPGMPENDIYYWLGSAQQLAGNKEEALSFFGKATMGKSEPSAAIFYNDQQPDKIFYQGLAWEKLNDPLRARQIFESLVQYGRAHMNDRIRLDYFAVSLPDLMIFDDDLDHRNIVHCLYMQSLGYLGLRNFEICETMLSEVLEKDAMHFGANTHLRLLKSMMLPQL